VQRTVELKGGVVKDARDALKAWRVKESQPDR
jgi:hypothetical protein